MSSNARVSSSLTGGTRFIDYIFINLNFIIMKLVKKMVKWYLEQFNKTYAWTPSCTIPFIKDKK